MVAVDAPAIQPWAPGPRPCGRSAGAIDVWRADLTAVEDELEDLLCAEERARAAQIVRERKRVLWARSRGVLRALLGRYLDRDPRDAALRARRRTASPRCCGDRAPRRPEDLRFNLSHSGTLALYAVTAGGGRRRRGGPTPPGGRARPRGARARPRAGSALGRSNPCARERSCARGSRTRPR